MDNEKKTYLARENPNDASSRLIEISGAEWYAITQQNKQLPVRERRFFIKSAIKDDFDGEDIMYIETSYEDYRRWHSENKQEDRIENAGKSFLKYSIDAVTAEDNYAFFMDALSVCGEMEESIQIKDTLRKLEFAVKAWEPWAYDIFRYYMAGKKRSCTSLLAQKYGVSEQIIRRRKKLFESFCKDFFEN